MKKKELEKEILELESQLDEVKQILIKYDDTLRFLATHDRKDVEIKRMATWRDTIFTSHRQNVAKFLHGITVYEKVLPLAVQDKSFVFSVLDNTETDCIIRADNNICYFYYKLDKTTQTLVEVTEFYKRAEIERTAKSYELKPEKEPTEEKCECECKKGGKK